MHSVKFVNLCKNLYKKKKTEIANSWIRNNPKFTQFLGIFTNFYHIVNLVNLCKKLAKNYKFMQFLVISIVYYELSTRPDSSNAMQIKVIWWILFIFTMLECKSCVLNFLKTIEPNYMNNGLNIKSGPCLVLLL